MAGLITRAANGVPLTWAQMDNNLLYLDSKVTTQTLQTITDNGNETNNDLTVVDDAANPIYQTTLSYNALNFYNNSGGITNGQVIKLTTPNAFTTSVSIRLPDKTGTIALLSDITNTIDGGIATASIPGGAGLKMQIFHSLGYTISSAVVTPINASSSSIAYYCMPSEYTSTSFTVRWVNVPGTTVMGYSYIVK